MNKQSMNKKVLCAKHTSIIVGVSLIVVSALVLPTRWWAFAYAFFLPIAAALLLPILVHLLEPEEKKAQYISKTLHKQEVKRLSRTIRHLHAAREQKIKKLEKKRWQEEGSNLSYNLLEGKVRINGKTYLFSDIKGGYISRQESSEVVSQKYKYSTFLGGPLLGQQELITETRQVCTHLGVVANVNGFQVEIILISRPTDITSATYQGAEKTAKRMLEKLQELSRFSVPEKPTPVELEEPIQALDFQIANAVSAYNAAVGKSTTIEPRKEQYARDRGTAKS